MENFKNVAPLSDFDWNAFENGVTESAQSKEELEKAYDKTLGSVNETTSLKVLSSLSTSAK